MHHYVTTLYCHSKSQFAMTLMVTITMEQCGCLAVGPWVSDSRSFLFGSK